MDIEEWLAGLGLAQYAAAFAAEGVDLSVVPTLSDQDLKDLGVALMGHRRKIMAEAARANEKAPAISSPAPAPARARDEAERRPITVMFCDLVGSTSLAAKLDAEDWRDLVGAYLDEASRAVTGYGGHVLKKLGDGLMALFGYPKAQENDAERAARAALAILRALEDLNARNAGRGLPALAARIGLESGPVVVDGTGEVFGDAPNVAARVQAAAEPGTLLVTAGVQRQVAGLFIVEDKGPHDLKGVSGRPNLYRLVRASGGGRRAGARAPTPLVGREDEIAALLRRWERARAGEGQFVQIVGEPGLGKSRLVEEFRARLVETPHSWIEWTSSQLLQNTPLHPLAEWGRLRFTGSDRWTELEAALAEAKLDSQEHAPLLAPLLDIAPPEARAARLPPEDLRRRQLASAVAWLTSAARRQPVALAFEDLHWADPTTLDLMKTLSERGASAPLMIVATARPEFRVPWSTRSHHSVVSLVPLDQAEIRRMVGAIAERHALTVDMVEGVARRTGGVPLFVEEVTRLMLEGGAQAIPPTLQQSLAARLDRLAEGREVAQIGAVLGREFSYSLLRAVAGLPEPALAAALDRLIDADLLFVEGVGSTASFRFKHALIQDAAYESLLKARRQALHRRAAESLLAGPDPQPELVAHHFTGAGDKEAAVEWWGKAGDAALKRSAFQEAIAHLGKAIAMTEGEGEQKRETASKLHSGYALATMMTKGFGAEDTRAALARAEDAFGTARTPEYWTLAYGRISGQLMRGEARAARIGADAFVAEAEAAGLLGHAAFGRRMRAFIRFVDGELAEADADIERALADFDEERDGPLQSAFAIDFRAHALAYRSQIAWLLGRIEDADRYADDAFRLAEVSGRPASLAAALYCRCVFAALRGDPRAVLDPIGAIREIAHRHGLGFWQAMASTYSDWAAVLLTGSRVAEYREGFKAWRELGAAMQETALLPLVAEVELSAGETDAALAISDHGLKLMAEQGLNGWRPYMMIVRGDILEATDPLRAEHAYREAFDLASAQGSRALALRASLALARRLASTDRSVDAHDVLALALEGFTPTPLFPAVAEAQALLATLADADELRQRRRVAELRAKYAQATLIVEGHTSAAAKQAFGRLDFADLVGLSEAEQVTALYGHWTGTIISGRSAEALQIAREGLNSARAANRRLLGIVAQRLFAISQYYGGSFAEAARSAEAALAMFEDSFSAVHFAALGNDLLCQTQCVASQLLSPAGDLAASGRLIDAAGARAAALGHPFVIASVQAQNTIRLWLADRPDDTLVAAKALGAVVEASGAGAWTAHAKMFAAWGTGRRSHPREAAQAIAQAWADVRAREARLYDPFALGLLADLALAAGDREEALRRADEGIESIASQGTAFALPLFLRLRGQSLAASDPAAAEAELREAVRIADEGGGRSLALLAALPLARLLQADNRTQEAHDALAIALRGFEPTPELPAIAEAQALLVELAAAPLVAAALRQREVRAKLHSGYALATMMTKGFAAQETKAALEQASRHSRGARTAEYWRVRYGRLAGALMSSGPVGMLDEARAFVAEAETAGEPGHACVARRALGNALIVAGKFAGAADLLRRVVAEHDEARDAGLSAIYGHNVFANARATLAQAVWYLGEIEEAEGLLAAALERAERSGHVISQIQALACRVFFNGQTLACDGALQANRRILALAETHDLAEWRHIAANNILACEVMLGGQGYGDFVADFERNAGGTGLTGSVRAALRASVELAVGRTDVALHWIERALTIGAGNGEGEFTSLRLRQRAAIRAARGAPDADTDFRAALDLARAQGSPTLTLLAALDLAKHLRSTGNIGEARNLLAAALSPLAPTPLLPAIAEAAGLLADLERRDPGKRHDDGA